MDMHKCLCAINVSLGDPRELIYTLSAWRWFICGAVQCWVTLLEETPVTE